jgi:hypothetical protein
MADDQQPSTTVPPNVAAPTTPVPLDSSTSSVVPPAANPLDGDKSQLGPVAAANPSTADTSGTQPNTANTDTDDTANGDQQPKRTAEETARRNPFISDDTPSVTKAPPPDPSAPAYVATGTPNSSHPDVQKAGVTNSIALALMGGPRYKTSIDPVTGATTRTQIPMSRKDVGLAIAMTAISGALSGLAQSGPNALAKAGVVGMQQGEKIAQGTQEANDKDAQQANADYARKAAITQANFQTHANQIKLSTMEHDYQQQHVTERAPELDAMNKVGGVVAQRVNATDALKKYNVTDKNAIPDGVIRSVKPDGTFDTNPDGSEKWENTFSIINPDVTIDLPQATKQYLADHMVNGFYKIVDGKVVPQDLPTDTPMKASYVVSGMAQAQNLQLTEDTINRQLSGLGDSADADKAQFQVNLRKALTIGSLSNDGMKVLSQYATLPLDHIADTMAKDKVDPKVIAQVRSIIPSDAVEKMKNERVATETKNKALAVIDSGPKANAILADPRSTPQQIASAKSFSANTQNQDVSKQAALVRIKAMTAGAEEGAKLSAQDRHQAQLDAKAVGDAEQFASQAPVNGVRQSYLNALPPQMQALVRNIGEYGQKPDILERGKEGKQLAQMVNTAYPGYNGKLYPVAQKTLEAFTGEGKEAQQVKSFNTLFDHLGGALEASNAYRRNGLGTELNKSMNWWKKNYSGDPLLSELQASIEPVKSEFMTFLGNNHALTEHDKKTGDILASEDMSPAVLEANFKKFAETAAFRAKETNGSYARVFGQNFPGLISPTALKTIQGLTDQHGNNKVADILGDMDTGGTFMGAANGRGKTGQTVKEALGRGGSNSTTTPQTSTTSTNPTTAPTSAPKPVAPSDQQFSHISASGKYGWNGKAWVPRQQPTK